MRRSTNTPHLGPYRFLRQYFNLHIPIHELPDRIDEVPRDKFVITFCLSDFGWQWAMPFCEPRGIMKSKP